MPTVYSPPVPTYTALATTTLAGAASSVTFASIPATYRDLILVADVAPSANGQFYLELNGSSSSFSSQRFFGGSILGAYADVGVNNNVGEFKATDTRPNLILQLFDYAQTDKEKVALTRSNGLDRVMMYFVRWASTAAVTSVAIVANAGTNFNSSSTFSLYGIEA